MTMKNIIIAPVGDMMEALYVGIREFPTEEVILISPKERINEANKARSELSKFKIPVRIIEINGNIWEEIFKEVAKIKKIETNRNIIVNVATGDRNSRCAATSAAFVNGLNAIAVEGNQAVALPVLKFSYYKLLTDKKMGLLKILSEPNCCNSLDELSRKTKMSLPLISYHINGNLKSDGLKQLGLVQTEEKRGRVNISLTILGRMLVKGHIE